MGLFSSFKKNKNLKRISDALGGTIDWQSENATKSAADMIRASVAGTGENKQEKALEELLDLCEQDKTLKGIMDANNATREDLKKIYHEIEDNGAGQWTRGHYVAASALAFGTTLDFCLNAKDKGLAEREIAFTLLDYYENNRVGKIDI